MKYKTLQSIGIQDPGVVYKEVNDEITKHHLLIGAIEPIDEAIIAVEVVEAVKSVEEIKAKKA
jgi:hypothetical protein